MRINEAFWARSLKVLSKLRKLNLRAMLDHHCPTSASEMLPSSQQQVQKFISTNIINVFTSQVLSFLRAVLHRVGLQDLIAVPQANVTSALNRLALLSCVKHHLMLPCRLMSMTKGGHLTLAELLHVLPPPRAMLPWLQRSSKLLRLPSQKIYILKAIMLFKSTQTQDPLGGVPCRLVCDNAPTHHSPSLS